MTPLHVSAFTLTNALGAGQASTLDALRQEKSGLRPCDLSEASLETWIGRVDGVEDVRLPATLRDFDCRNHRLALLALEQDGFMDAVAATVARVGAARVALFLGTSTSGIGETEAAYRQLGADGRLPDSFHFHQTHNLFALSEFCRRVLGLRGPASTISTACSSSAKVLAMAWRHIEAGLCDAAVVGGVDSLCLTTLYGFRSLELVSRQPCRPWDKDRDGISIGEAAGFALLTRADSGEPALSLMGYGETSDAYHMSAPHPEGAGAALAIRRALDRAGLTADAIDYVNLHGTSTPANDAAEDKAVLSVLGPNVRCSSTKGATGHTLGAAGITEAAICCLSIQHGLVPASIGTRQIDPELKLRIVRQAESRPVRFALTNSLGFGGSNSSLIFGVPA